MSDWKEYIIIIISVATLIVAIATFIISRRSLNVAKSSMKNAQEIEKRKLINDLKSKEAQLKSSEWLMMHMATNDAMIQREMLKAEIEQLKEQLKDERVERI